MCTCLLKLRDDFYRQDDGNVTTRRVAEGGRYDDLVRHFRPPGNFGSIVTDRYTAARYVASQSMISQ